ncbi:hypothetical protein HC256_000500 [Beauveria bassiana]|nr:hypothetical protein HC256_000500 [Beauveria bassiana]
MASASVFYRYSQQASPRSVHERIGIETYLSSLRSKSRSLLSRILSRSHSLSRLSRPASLIRSLAQSRPGDLGGLSLSNRMSRIGEALLRGLLGGSGDRRPGGGDLCTGDLRIGERAGIGVRDGKDSRGDRVLSRRLGLSWPPRSLERSRLNPMLLDLRRGTYRPGT